jgi:glycosyltransferase involved in cell wall biosynthesis
MYEYLATGKPVVSSAMPEVIRHEDVVGIGRSPGDFLAKIDAAIAEDTEEKAERRREVARANSWADRVARTAKIISDALGGQ